MNKYKKWVKNNDPYDLNSGLLAGDEVEAKFVGNPHYFISFSDRAQGRAILEIRWEAVGIISFCSFSIEFIFVILSVFTYGNGQVLLLWCIWCIDVYFISIALSLKHLVLHFSDNNRYFSSVSLSLVHQSSTHPVVKDTGQVLKFSRGWFLMGAFRWESKNVHFWTRKVSERK